MLSTSIGPIISLLDEPDTLAKRTGLHLLSHLQPRSLLVAIVPRILALLGDKDGEVRRAVVPVLRALPPDALDDDAHAAALLAYLGPEQPCPRVRSTALYALTALPPARLAEELDAVLERVLVEEEPSGVRFAALDVLQALLGGARRFGGGGGEEGEGGGDDCPTGADASSSNNDSDSNSNSNSPLRPVLAAQAARVVARFADVDDRFVRWKAQSVVGSFPASLFRERPEALAALVGCLAHEYACTRGAGLLALGRLGAGVLTEEAVGAMAARLADAEPAVRWAAAHALKKQLGALCGYPGMAAGVAEEAGRRLGEEGEDVWVQWEAHRLLCRLAPEGVVGAEAAAAMRAFEARSEAGEDEVGEGLWCV